MNELLAWIGAQGGTFGVRVTPNASSARLGALPASDEEQVLRVYVTCVPEDGKANAAVIELLAKSLKVAKSSLEIVRGQTSRLKVIRLIG